MERTFWLDKKNEEIAKQVARVFADNKATCSDVKKVMNALWDYLTVSVSDNSESSD